MYTSFRHDGDKLLVDIPEYLRRHDIVYKRPSYKRTDGFPVGNGKAGALVSLKPDALVCTLNHSDAVDYRKDGNFSAWSWEDEEKNTSPASCAEFRLSFPCPVFDWVYLKDFSGRLNIAEAAAEYRAESAFSKVNCRLWAAEDPSVIIFEVSADFDEAYPLTVTLSNWGSPSFFHHYEQVVDTHDRNMKNTSVDIIDGKTALLERKLQGCTTAAGMELKAFGDSELSFTPEQTGPNRCDFRIAPSESHRFYIIISCDTTAPVLVSSTEEIKQRAKPAARVCRNLAEASTALEGSPEAPLWKRHIANWSSFWNRSFVHLGREDYLENLYYFHLYQLNSCSRGSLPLTFAGLWGWFKDSRNWGHFYHWNHQQTYWGLDCADHGELSDNYYNYRFGMLENAGECARDMAGTYSGAFYSDITNFNGYNALEPDTIRNFTVGPQIALDFYRHARYSGDEDFLTDKAIPMMCAAAEFYLSALEQDNDGLMRIRGGSTAYESYWNLKETLTDRVMIQNLFEALIELGERVKLPQGLCESMLEALETLPPLPSVSLKDDQACNGIDKILSAGVKWDGASVEYGEGKYPLSPFPAVLTAPIFPDSLKELSNPESEVFRLCRDTARILFDRDVYQPGSLDCSGHNPAPQTAARLNMGGDALRLLRHFARTYQMFPNGFMHFADISRNQQWSSIDIPRVLEPDEHDTRWEEIHDKSKGRRTSIGSDCFLHCYFEAESNIFSGINENLLQSHGGIIRPFPVDGGFSDACFSLRAEGGFNVTGEKHKGIVRYIIIKSLLAEQLPDKQVFPEWGKICLLRSPWSSDKALKVRASDGRDIAFGIEDGIIRLDFTPGETYRICPADENWDTVYYSSFEYSINEDVKYLDTPADIPGYRAPGVVDGTVQLGLPPLY